MYIDRRILLLKYCLYFWTPFLSECFGACLLVTTGSCENRSNNRNNQNNNSNNCSCTAFQWPFARQPLYLPGDGNIYSRLADDRWLRQRSPARRYSST